MSSITAIAKQVAVSHDENVVNIELICTDVYAAVVLYDDILGLLKSKGGLRLSVRCDVKQAAE